MKTLVCVAGCHFRRLQLSQAFGSFILKFLKGFVRMFFRWTTKNMNLWVFQVIFRWWIQMDHFCLGFCCYLLRSFTRSRAYTGITTDLSRRLRQHNGELRGGAKATRTGGPWQVVCVVPWWKTGNLLKSSEVSNSFRFVVGLSVASSCSISVCPRLSMYSNGYFFRLVKHPFSSSTLLRFAELSSWGPRIPKKGRCLPLRMACETSESGEFSETAPSEGSVGLLILKISCSVRNETPTKVVCEPFVAHVIFSFKSCKFTKNGFFNSQDSRCLLRWPRQGGMERRCANLLRVLSLERWTKESRPAAEMPLQVQL